MISIKKIAKEYELKIFNLTKNNIKKFIEKYGEISEEDSINNAYLFDDCIILGFYDNPELKRAAFFHELGHTLVTESFERLVNNDELLIEYEAWIQGLKVAKKYKYNFSNKTFKYILQSTNSYYKDALKAYYKKPKRKCRKNKNLQQKFNTNSKNKKIFQN